MNTTTNTTKIIIAVIVIALIALAVMMTKDSTMSPTDSVATTTVGSTNNAGNESNTTTGGSVNPSNGQTSGTVTLKPGEIMTVTPKDNQLAGTSWIWKSTTFANKNPSKVPAANKFVITFNDKGMFTSTTDCNAITGQYAVKGDRLTLTNTASTLMACQGETLEGEYANELTHVTNYVFESTAELNLMVGNTATMSFTKRQ